MAAFRYTECTEIGYGSGTSCIAIGRKSRELGELFESWALRDCDWYWDKGNAYIEKTPEPMRQIKVYGNRKKEAVYCCLHETGQLDFKGTLCDDSKIIFDAKSTGTDFLWQSIVTDE